MRYIIINLSEKNDNIDVEDIKDCRKLWNELESLIKSRNQQ